MRFYALIVLAVVTPCIGASIDPKAEEQSAITLWQKAQSIPEGQNPKADLAREVLHGVLTVVELVPEGIIASGSYGSPGYFKPKDAYVFGADLMYNFPSEILVVGYQRDVTDGDLFTTVLYPCGVYKYFSRTLKRYATTIDKAWALMHPPTDVGAQIEQLEIEKKKIEEKITELRKKQAQDTSSESKQILQQ